MSRKRMLDPGIWTDEGFLEMSPLARLLFIGLVSLADDDGRGVAATRSLKAKIFPGDDLGETELQNLKEEVRQHTRTRFYAVSEQDYYQLDRWHDYQKMPRTSESTIPPIDETVINHFTNDDEPLSLKEKKEKKEKKERVRARDSATPHEPKTERAPGVTLTDSEIDTLTSKHGPELVAEAIEYLSAYKQAHAKTYKSDAGALRQFGIQAALERREKKRGKGGTSPPRPGVVEFKARKCPECGHTQHSSSASCLECGEDMRAAKTEVTS